MCSPNLPGYKLMKEIGSGTSGVVFKAHHESLGKFVAIKCISRKNISPKAVDCICSEITILKALKHQNIVNMHAFHWDKNFVYIVMDYCEGGDLHSYLKLKKKLSERSCSKVFHQIVNAFTYLHGLNVAHMDLKPQNILLTSVNPPIIKVADFGLADILHDEDTKNGIRGSPLYMAPEILRHQKYDKRADVWSLGVILHECLFGHTPFRGSTLDDLVKKIVSDSPVQITSLTSLSSSCGDLLTGLLKKNPDQRLSFDNLLHHSFLTQPCSTSNEASSEPALLSQTHFELKSVPHKPTQRNHRGTFPDPASNGVEQVKVAPCSPLRELHALSVSTPEMKTAIDIGIEGVTYDAEGRYKEAFTRYESAISILLKLLKTEPKGRRRTLIQQQATLWITRAEEIKTMHGEL